jgi:transcriptional regulator with XRE-family HTH domain
MTSKAAAWLLDQRTSRNLSLRELALETRLTHTTISDAEKGKASLETWKTLAEYFKTPAIPVPQWAGFLDAIPAKDELIDQIENDLSQINPAGRSLPAWFAHCSNPNNCNLLAIPRTLPFRAPVVMCSELTL